MPVPPPGQHVPHGGHGAAGGGARWRGTVSGSGRSITRTDVALATLTSRCKPGVACCRWRCVWPPMRGISPRKPGRRWNRARRRPGGSGARRGGAFHRGSGGLRRTDRRSCARRRPGASDGDRAPAGCLACFGREGGGAARAGGFCQIPALSCVTLTVAGAALAARCGRGICWWWIADCGGRATRGCAGGCGRDRASCFTGDAGGFCTVFRRLGGEATPQTPA